jgi:hypothetical protein
MKTKLLLAILVLSTIANAQIVNIPDANFKSLLVANTSINTNADAEIQTSEAAAYTGIINANINRVSIADLTGIEAFTAITYLNCGGSNSLTSLNVSANTALTTAKKL